MPDPLFDLTGRTIVITGGLGRLGRQFTLACAQRGASVAILDVTDDASRLAPFAEHADCVALFKADLTSRESVEQAHAKIVDRFGVPHGLVNNAGLDSPPDAPAAETGPFEDYPDASWEKVLGVNLTGVFHACQVIGGAMAREGRGSVINVSSIYGQVSPNQTIYDFRREATGEAFFKPVAYSVSKSGLFNFTRYLATYWAPQKVRVNTVTFAGVFDNQPKEFLDAYLKLMPLGRMADPGEYNGAVVFLLSDASSYMTGSNLVMDGGWTAW